MNKKELANVERFLFDNWTLNDAILKSSDAAFDNGELDKAEVLSKRLHNNGIRLDGVIKCLEVIGYRAMYEFNGEELSKVTLYKSDDLRI